MTGCVAAYSRILATAAQFNVPIEQQAPTADYKTRGSNYMS